MKDALVIGGGFYGAAIALYLARSRGFGSVVLVEREGELLQRASLRNQSRVHTGYHYPRSFTTAFRSRVNSLRFIRDYPDAIRNDFTALYAVARRNSKVTARQFRRFIKEIGAPLEPVSAAQRALFDRRLIEEVFLVEEKVFDSSKLKEGVRTELAAAGVEIRLGTAARSVEERPGRLAVRLGSPAGEEEVEARYVFNCTYSGLNQLGGAFPGTGTKLKHEIAEMALVRPPAALAGLGVTVMDGAFFSMISFPTRDLYTLSHVRYTPHLSWIDEAGVDPNGRLAAYPKESRADRMVRDAGRYMPAVLGAAQADSLFEVKTVLVKNEGDDGRPILFERHPALPRCYSILGGKIDNIYDILERLELEALD